MVCLHGRNCAAIERREKKEEQSVGERRNAAANIHAAGAVPFFWLKNRVRKKNVFLAPKFFDLQVIYIYIYIYIYIAFGSGVRARHRLRPADRAPAKRQGRRRKVTCKNIEYNIYAIYNIIYMRYVKIYNIIYII